MNTYKHSIVNQLLLLLAVFWNEFLPWYLIIKPLQIVRSYWAYTKVFWRICSFIFLIKTLFSPWKNITQAYPSTWLDFVGVAQALTMNVTARCVGFCVRIGTICFGIILELATAIFFIVYLFAWLLFPFCLGLGVLFIFTNL